MTVQLNREERAFIAEQYDDCLCANCMKAMKREYKLQPFKKAWRKVFGQPFNRKK
jgi:hypothetical protein